MERPGTERQGFKIMSSLKCDKCQSSIIHSKCNCGYWYQKGQEPSFFKTLERAIMAYDHLWEQNSSSKPISGDHYSGNCIIPFKGNYDTCEKVKEFIELMKK